MQVQTERALREAEPARQGGGENERSAGREVAQEENLPQNRSARRVARGEVVDHEAVDDHPPGERVDREQPGK